jgi:hypothetical protein
MAGEFVGMTEKQLVEAQQALDIAALNGLVSLALLLKKRGLMTKDEAKSMHDLVTKPLSLPDVADNPLIQDAARHLDELFAILIEPR